MRVDCKYSATTYQFLLLCHYRLRMLEFKYSLAVKMVLSCYKCNSSELRRVMNFIGAGYASHHGTGGFTLNFVLCEVIWG